MARFTKSRLFLAAALPLLAPSLPAHAQQNPNQRAEAEARAMLPKCQQPTHEQQQTCLKNQQGFIREYVRAKAGSEINIRGVASYLRPLPPTANEFDRNSAIGAPINLFESCAWLVWYSLMPPDEVERSMPPLSFEGAMQNKRRYPDSRCAQLPRQEELRARRRGEQLMQEYVAAPARMPPSDWQPKVAGLVEPKPSPPIPAHCLNTRSVPLRVPGQPAPDLPEFVPPKGCPNRP